MDIIKNIIIAMQDTLTTEQLQKLEHVLHIQFGKAARQETEAKALTTSTDGWRTVLNLFLASKRLANCAESTLEQYDRALRMMITTINKPLDKITTNDLRYYMALYQERRKVSPGYMNTLRLYFSSFFCWAQDEEILTRNPAKRLDKIKVPEKLKHPFTPTEMSALRDNCKTLRDRALLEVLYSTAGRVSEVCSIDISDVDFASREVIIYGQKGKRERRVYLTEESVYYLKKYLLSRGDDSPALFVGLIAPHNRMTKGGVEYILRELGRKCGIHCHPHKFRRTMLTEQGKRGMLLQDIQRYAGHRKPDTTMMYVSVADSAVKSAFNRLIA